MEQQEEPVSGTGLAIVTSKVKGETGDGEEIEGEGTELVSLVVASLWWKHGKISSHTKMECVTATVQCGDEYFSLLVPPDLDMSEVCAHHRD